MNKGWAPRAVVAALVWLAVGSTKAATTPVQTESGLVEGIQDSGVVVYRGIPYAKPPLGSLRWREPQATQSWSGVRKADRFSPVCMQSGSYPPDAPTEPSSEDCLYLNVWTPVPEEGQTRPVMFWIYGGGLQNGSSSTPLYAGDKLAQKGVIVVTANYRLGVFGFLAHPDLTKESEHKSSGNYGLLDQIAALRWVQRNIAAFGGDPHRVTLFGQSSGSISISALVTSPLTRGLFQRVIGQSGGLFEPLEMMSDFKLEGAEQAGRRFVAQTGAATLDALRRKPAAEVMTTSFNAHPIIDGYVLTQTPYDAYRNHQGTSLPLLVGSNADEGQSFIAGRTVTVENFKRTLTDDFPSVLVRLIGPEPGATNTTARASAATFNRDMRFRWDMWTWARLAAEDRSRVFLYEFSRAPPYPAGSKYAGWGASHGMEMPYMFDHLDQQGLPWAPEDHALAFTMSTYWSNFAKFGNPNGPGLPPWPVFESSNRQLMLLGDTIRPGPVSHEGDLKRIDRVYSAVRFILRNRYELLAVGVFTLLLVMAAVGRRLRRP
jgi:para-nitrobenzyl esterase